MSLAWARNRNLTVANRQARDDLTGASLDPPEHNVLAQQRTWPRQDGELISIGEPIHEAGAESAM